MQLVVGVERGSSLLYGGGMEPRQATGVNRLPYTSGGAGNLGWPPLLSVVCANDALGAFLCGRDGEGGTALVNDPVQPGRGLGPLAQHDLCHRLNGGGVDEYYMGNFSRC